MEMKSDRIEVAVGFCYGAHGRCCRTAGFADLPRLHPPSFVRLRSAPLITPFIYRMQIECVALLSAGARALPLCLFLLVFVRFPPSLAVRFRGVATSHRGFYPLDRAGKQHARRPSPITRAFAVDRRFTCSGRRKKEKITATTLDECTPDTPIVSRANVSPDWQK